MRKMEKGRQKYKESRRKRKKIYVQDIDNNASGNVFE